MAGAGDVLNSRYALRALIDSGATADVYLADDLRLGRQVAVKVLSAEQARAERGIERFRREAQAAAALSHPNVVAVYDWGKANETAFLVMQYVAGSDLRSVLRERGRLTEATALRVAAEIAAALEVAHQHGIVHRDVKPRNVLIDAHGSALLADFGIAAPTNGTAERDSVYGTALYVSPEQAQGLTVDGRADLYSLGAVLYELLTGQPPFRGETPGEVARQHVSAVVVPPRAVCADVSAAAERVMMRALEKDPARRFASAAQMRAALLAGHAGPGVAAGSEVEVTAPLALAAVEAARLSGSRALDERHADGGAAAGEAAAAGASPVPDTSGGTGRDEIADDLADRGWPRAADTLTRDVPRATYSAANGSAEAADVLADGRSWASRAAANRSARLGDAVAGRRGWAASRGGERRFAAGAVPRWALLVAPLVVLVVVALIGLPALARGRPANAPELAGLGVQDAQAAIAAAGLQLSIEEQATQDTPAGIVVTQDPLPGTHPAAGSTVHAVVSNGISVPDLSGQQCAAARAALAQAGWTVRPVRWRVANVADFGKVVAQDPAPGAVVKAKGEISVQVAGPVRPC
jgi:tRNA A-37 threonylcarbamoyl transferase component Bud32